MRGVLTIFAKDLRSFMVSPAFYLVAGFFTLVLLLYAIVLAQFLELSMNSRFQMGMTQEALNIHYSVFMRHFSHINLLLIFFVPALTMKLLSEERKLRTYDLLLTSPITSAQIILGKYLAALVATLVLLGISFIYPLWTAYYASFNWAPLLIGYGGMALVCAVYVAVNLFSSSLSESALIAYVIGVVMNISLWFVGYGVDIVDSASVRAIFEHISLNTHLSGLVEGVIRTPALVFLLSLIALFCFLSERVVEASRWR